jgi:ribosome-associated protein
MSTRPSKKAGEHPQSDVRTAAPPEFPAELQNAIRAAFSKKATNMVVLDLRDGTAFTDFFLICSGQNARNVHAIVDAIEEALRTGESQRKPSHVEGYPASDWVLLDYFDFIVHVFTPETREFYALERLWGNAERIEIDDEPHAGTSGTPDRKDRARGD